MSRGLAIVPILCALLAGCGGSGNGGASGGSGGPPPPRGAAAAGKRTFQDAGCGGCHTLAAASAAGEIGPKLDDSDVTYREAFAQVRDGGGGMPSFRERLSAPEIADVAQFVVSERG